MSEFSNHTPFNDHTLNRTHHASTPNSLQGITDERQVIPYAVFLLAAIAFLGLAGNFLVLRAIFRLKRRRFHEYLVLNLASTDLGTCGISIPLDAVEKVIGRFPFGATLCRVVYPFQSVLVYVSVLTLMLMTGERFRLIVTPMKQKIGLRPGLTAIFGSWILSVLFVLPLSLALRYEEPRCLEYWTNVFNGKSFTLTIFLLLYVVPLITMKICYSFMLRVFFNDTKSVKLGQKLGMSHSMAETRMHRNLRIIRVLAAAVVAFALCMLPTHVSWLWHDFGNGSQSSHFPNVVLFSNIAMYANSVLNPFIFGSINISSLTKLCPVFIRGHSRRRDGFGKVFELRVRSFSTTRRPSIFSFSQPSNLRVLHNQSNLVSETKPRTNTRETIV